jgi:hypothetical protein
LAKGFKVSKYRFGRAGPCAVRLYASLENTVT